MLPAHKNRKWISIFSSKKKKQLEKRDEKNQFLEWPIDHHRLHRLIQI